MSSHEHYEVLCASAASGHASDDEIEELRAHLQQCVDCRSRLTDFAQLSAQALPLHAEIYSPRQAPPEMTARFIQRANLEGIPLHQPGWFWPRRAALPRLAWMATAVCTIATVVLFIGLHRVSVRGIDNQGIAATGSHKSPANVHSDRTISTQSSTLAIGHDIDHQQLALLRAQLSASQLEIEQLKRQLATLARDLNTSESARSDLLSRLSTAENNNAALRLDISSKTARMADLEDQLKQKDSTNVDEIAALAEKQVELGKLSSDLAERERDLDQQQRLLAASAQARDLITARNLHIIDVHDNDHSGRQRPFGRIFYTEGQSLVFYAYDLGPPDGLVTKLAFHVWGGSLRDQQQVQSLGVLRVEDSAAGRWILTCNDTRVLTQINTVFVTAESAQNNLDRPKGRRILFAFLGDRPNHP